MKNNYSELVLIIGVLSLIGFIATIGAIGWGNSQSNPPEVPAYLSEAFEVDERNQHYAAGYRDGWRDGASGIHYLDRFSKSSIDSGRN